MSELLKQRQEQANSDLSKPSEPKFQTFHDINPNSAKLKELLFFTRIAVFSVMTVVIAFFLLVMNFASVWAFLIAALVSLAITSAISAFIWSFNHS